MKYDLVELVVQLLCDWMVMGSNHGEPKLIFFLLILVFGMNVKGQGKP